MKGDTRILDLFLLFRMSKEEIIGLINEKQPVVFVSGEHAYMVRDYRCDMTEQTPRMLGGFMDWNIERSYEECSPIGEVKIVLEADRLSVISNLIPIMKNTAELAGFEVVGRIVLKDKHTGKEYR